MGCYVQKTVYIFTYLLVISCELIVQVFPSILLDFPFLFLICGSFLNILNAEVL